MNKPVRIFVYAVVILFLLLGLVVALFESGPGRALAQKILVEGLRRSGVEVEVGSLGGRIPQQIDLKKVVIKGVSGYTVAVDEMHLTLSLVHLIRKELRIESLTADGVAYAKEPPSKRPARETALPFSLNVESFSITRLQTPQIFDLSGHLKIGKYFRRASFQCVAVRPEFPNAGLELAVKKLGEGDFSLDLSVDSESLQAFRPWLALDAEGESRFQLYAKGNPERYSGKFNGAFHATSLPFLAPLDQVNERAWVFRGKLEKKEGKPLALRHLIASSDVSRIKGMVQLNDSYKVDSGRLQVEAQLDRVSDAKGTLFTTIEFTDTDEGLDASARWYIPLFRWGDATVDMAKGTVDGLITKNAFFGKGALAGQFLSEPWTLQTPIVYRSGDALILEKIEIDSPLLRADGNLVYRGDGLWIGKINVEKGNLQLVQRYRPALTLFGQASGSCSLAEIDGAQTVQAQLDAKEIYFGAGYAKEAQLQFDMGRELSAELREVKYDQLLLDTAQLSAEGNAFHFSLAGQWKDPLEGAIDGLWQVQNGELMLTVQEASGTLLQYPIALEQPAKIGWQEGYFLCEQLRASVGLAEIQFDFKGQPHNSDGKLILDRVPLDFLSLNPLDVAVSGIISLEAQLQERGQNVTADVKASVERVRLKAPGEEQPLLAQGSFHAHYDRDRLGVQGALEATEVPVVFLDLNLPIAFHLWPFSAKLLMEKQADCHFAMSGRIEDYLDFFDFGAHRLEGSCVCNLQLDQTLANPRVTGFCKFENGYYQNYVSGTELTGLHADIEAQDDKLRLESFTGHGLDGKGSLMASGALSLNAKERFPFHFDVAFQELNVVQIDYIAAEAEGKMTIDGNLDAAIARGELQISKTEMTIPSKLPPTIPDLKVVYKNAPKPIAYVLPHLRSPYPLHLDLSVKAPGGIFIGGRGLQSEWKGDFHIGGTFTSLAPKGKLELISGDLLFASRTFKLSDGTVTLSGKEREMPFLDISANIAQKGVSITARLRGPLNQPQLTFQSTPPLPLNSILAHLLFGQDLPEINSFQALQLASTAASLQGDAPDVLESTRRSLGIDRLQIVSTPSGDDEVGDLLALQVGKYIAQGVIVSISQGAEDSSTNISIEVDIANGFVFQAESQQQQEQGKFTLKWNHNY